MFAQVYFQLLSDALTDARRSSGNDSGVIDGATMLDIADNTYDMLLAQYNKIKALSVVEERDARIHKDLVDSGKLVEFPNGRPTA